MVAIRANIPEDLYELVKQWNGDSQDALDEAVTTALRQVYADQSSPPLSIDEERQRIREAFGDILAPQGWLSGWLDELGGPMTPEEEEEYYRTAPVLAPPLSQTLIEMRDEERY